MKQILTYFSFCLITLFSTIADGNAQCTLGTIPPTLLNVPVDITIQCSADEPPIAANLTGTDACGNILPVRYQQENLQEVCGGFDLKRTWWVEDAKGNRTEGIQIISLRDETPPIFTNFPPDLTINLDLGETIPEMSLPQTTENCLGYVNIFFDENTSTDSNCQHQKIERLYIATDKCGNQNTQTQTITLLSQQPIAVDAGPDQTILKGVQTQLNGIGGPNLNWTPIDRLVNTFTNSPFTVPLDTTTIFCATVYDEQLGCSLMDCVTIFVESTQAPQNCTFSDTQKQLEYETLVAILAANPNSSLHYKDWKPLKDTTTCDICILTRVNCDENGYVIDLDLSEAKLVQIPKEIEQLTNLRSLQLFSNQLNCLPEELGGLCGIESIQNGLSGNPIAGTIQWCDFCATPQDICVGGSPISSLPEDPESNTSSIDCEKVNFTADMETITVRGLKAVSSSVQILSKNTDWEVITICDGDCGETVEIPDVYTGEYLIKVGLLGVDKSHCYREETVNVVGNEPLKEGIADCNAIAFIGKERQIEVANLTASYNKIQLLGKNTNWETITICDGNCNEIQNIPNLYEGEYLVKVAQIGKHGGFCYREETVQVSGSSQPIPEKSANCTAVEVIAIAGTIQISQLNATYNKVEYLGVGTNWEIITLCDGNCSSNQTIDKLPNGEYKVKIQQTGEDGSYCFREWAITITQSTTSSRSRNSIQLASHQKNQQVALQWAVNSIEHTKYFLVERSKDGQHFEALGLVPSSSNKLGYHWMDLTPSSNINHYRIRQLFDDQQFQYSAIRTEQFMDAAKIMLFPNPANEVLNIQMKSLLDKTGTVSIFNTFGQSMHSIPLKTFKSPYLKLDLQSIPSGIYWLNIAVEGQRTMTKRFVIEHWK